MSNCSACHGKGTLTRTALHKDDDGFRHCPMCEATGIQPGTSGRSCNPCHGTGRIHQIITTYTKSEHWLSRFTKPKAIKRTRYRICQSCGGTGKVDRPYPWLDDAGFDIRDAHFSQ